MDGRSGPDGGGAYPARHGVRHQAGLGAPDRALDLRRCPFSWEAADTVYRVGEIETALRRAGKGLVPGVASSQLWIMEGQAHRGRHHQRDRHRARRLRLDAAIGRRGN